MDWDEKSLLTPLKRYRERRHETTGDIARRLVGMLAKEKGKAAIDLLNWLAPQLIKKHGHNLPIPKLARNIGLAEDGKKKTLPDERTLASLCKVYGLPFSIIFPLYNSRPIPGPARLEVEKFEPLASHFSADGQSRRCSYNFPQHRLRSSEAVIVRLKLGPEGESELHQHVGDELIFVVRGQLEIKLTGLGIRSRTLGESDYFHFFGEHLHQAINPSDEPAEAIVIRFHPYTGGYRGELQRQVLRLEQEMAGENLDAIRDILNDHLIPWVKGAEAEFDPLSLGNRQGLAGLLRSYSEYRGIPLASLQKALHEIESSIRKSGNTDGRDAWERELVKLAALCGAPDFLFSPYLHPRVHNFVVMRPDGLESAPLGISGTGSEYKIPKRMLAGSDTSIGYVALDPGGYTSENDHPGTEFILPINGNVTVEMPGMAEVHLSATPMVVGHFDSTIKHIVRNASDSEPAKFFVIRLYEYVPSKSDNVRSKTK